MPDEQARKYGNQFKCTDCHSSYRFCRDSVKGWSKLTAKEKSEYIKANKGKGGRGKKRELVTATTVWASVLNISHQCSNTETGFATEGGSQ